MLHRFFLLLFIFPFGLVQSATSFIDFQQKRIDLLDQVEDGQVSFSSYNYSYFSQIDSIQEVLEDHKLSETVKKKVKLAIYYDLLAIDSLYLFKEYKAPTAYKRVLDFLKLNDSELEGLFLIRDITKSYDVLPYLGEYDLVHEFIVKEAYSRPDLYFKNYPHIYTLSYAQDLLVALIKLAPLEAKRYFSTPLFKGALLQSKDSISQLILDIHHQKGAASKAFLLLDKINDGSLTINEASLFPNENTEAYFSTLLELSNNKKGYAKHSIDQELRFLCTKKIRQINAEFEQHNNQLRFAPLKSYSSKELYSILVYSEEEIFTSSFNGLFDMLFEKLDAEEKNVFLLLEEVSFNQLTVFIKLCTSYGKLDFLLDKLSKLEQDIVFSKFLSLEDNENMLQKSIFISDMIGSLSQTDSSTIVNIENRLWQNYKKARNEAHRISYSLLLKLLQETQPSKNDSILILTRKINSKPSKGIDSTSLFGIDSIHTQVHLFYNDKDGVQSYNSFIAKWPSANWIIKEKNGFIEINSRTGNPVCLYVNQVKEGRTGIDNLFNYLETEEITIEVLVHRGHSFYVPKSLERLDPETKLVFLGSCGGYSQVYNILKTAPSAQVISTKQIGSYTVNNPLLLNLANTINVSGQINWVEFWKELGENYAINSYGYNKFIEYIPPHLNLGVAFINAYNNQLDYRVK